MNKTGNKLKVIGQVIGVIIITIVVITTILLGIRYEEDRVSFYMDGNRTNELYSISSITPTTIGNFSLGFGNITNGDRIIYAYKRIGKGAYAEVSYSMNGLIIVRDKTLQGKALLVTPLCMNVIKTKKIPCKDALSIYGSNNIYRTDKKQQKIIITDIDLQQQLRLPMNWSIGSLKIK